MKKVKHIERQFNELMIIYRKLNASGFFCQLAYTWWCHASHICHKTSVSRRCSKLWLALPISKIPGMLLTIFSCLPGEYSEENAFHFYIMGQLHRLNAKNIYISGMHFA